jgi:virulence-associated protein VagC
MGHKGMQTAKVFMNGRSQAIRLPKEFRVEASGVQMSHNVIRTAVT